MIRRSVVLKEDAPAATTSLIVTVMGPDRPGIVSLLSDRAQRHGANWTASRLSRLAGEFAGMVHFEVPPDSAEALAEALRALESSGLRVVIAKSQGAAAPAGQRGVALELVGDDRLGIVSNVTRILAEHGISIENIHTEVVRGEAAGKPDLQGRRAPSGAEHALDRRRCSSALGVVANEMMVDIALDERPAGGGRA